MLHHIPWYLARSLKATGVYRHALDQDLIMLRTVTQPATKGGGS